MQRQHCLPLRAEWTRSSVPPRHNHNAIELHAVTLFWEDGALFVHDASQAVAQTAWTLAEIFDLDE